MAFPDLGRAGSRGQKRARGNRKRGKRARNTGMWPKLAPRAPRAPFPPAPRWAPGTPGPSRERPDPHLHEPPVAPPVLSLRPPSDGGGPLRPSRCGCRPGPSCGGLGPGERGGPAPPPATPPDASGGDPGVPIGAGTGATAGIQGRRSDPRGQRPGRVGSGVTRVQAGQGPGRDRG